MLTVALSLMLTQPLHAPAPSLQGALIAESPRSARLLDEVVLAQLPPVPPPGPLASPQQLQVDIAALKRLRPGIGGGIALVAAGGGVALAGGFYVGIGVAANVVPVWAIGVAALSIGLPLATIGIWLLVNAITTRGRIDQEIDALRKELALQQQQQLVPGNSGLVGPYR